MNERLRSLKAYPKDQLDAKKAEIAARGERVFDLGAGDPPDPTPEVVRRALIEAVPETSAYSSVVGTKAMREAAASYVSRRFGVEVDPQREVLPTAGSKEAIFHMPMIVVDPRSGRDVVAYAEPAYPVFAIGTYYAEAETHAVTLTDEHRYLFGPEDLGDDVLARTALVFLNYPHNPSGQEMPPEQFERWVAARDEHGFVIVSDECYCDIYFDTPPRSLLEFGREGCIAIHSLSKRSGMTGYQIGFMAGDPELISTLRHHRSAMGVATPVWSQAAAVASLSDDAHVEAKRQVLTAKRTVLLDMLESRGIEVYPSSATLFLWVRVPEGETDIEYAERLLEHGILVSPGSFYGPSQGRFIRLALVPSLEECREIAELWPRA